MPDVPDPASQHTAANLVFVPMSGDGGFACYLDLDADRQKAYAFTSRQKAKDFICIMGQAGFFPEIDRIQPCALGEWADWQRQKNLPDLAIDIDPHSMPQRSLDVAFDPAKQNLLCVTTEHPDGMRHQVHVSPRDEQTS